MTATLGTRKAEGNFDLPQDVPEGQYRIAFKISAFNKEDELTRDLYVRKGSAMGQHSGNSHVEQRGRQLGEKSIKSPGDRGGNPAKGAKAEVLSKTLNLRREPSTKSDIEVVIQQGDIYEIVEQKNVSRNRWIKLKLDDGTEGWAHSKYLRVIE